MSAATVPVRIRPTIILFGDSITEFAFGQNGQVGWASLLSSEYSRRADVLSRGFSGYNTQHALGIMSSIFGGDNGENNKGVSNTSVSTTTAKTPLLFCTVFFGANDASLPSARQHLSINEYDKNIRQIITNIRKSIGTSGDAIHSKEKESEPAAPPIILFTPTPVSPKAWDHYCSVTSPRPLSPRSNEKSKEYGLRVKNIGKEMDCAVVDTFSLLGGDCNEDHYNQYLTDGLHLNGHGNTIVFNGLMDVLRKHHKYLLPMVDGDNHGIPLEEKLWSELC